MLEFFLTVTHVLPHSHTDSTIIQTDKYGGDIVDDAWCNVRICESALNMKFFSYTEWLFDSRPDLSWPLGSVSGCQGWGRPGDPGVRGQLAIRNNPYVRTVGPCTGNQSSTGTSSRGRP